MLPETLLNVLVSLPPSDFIAVMAATAIRAAIRPYSMAVAPLEFLKIFVMKVMFSLLKKYCINYPALWFPISTVRFKEIMLTNI